MAPAKLKSIGLKPISNIVDITNLILHETGQPRACIRCRQDNGQPGDRKNLPEGTPFVTLDDKERKLSASDLMICNSAEPMCIAGVYGGKHSGVTDLTKNIFLEAPGSARAVSARRPCSTTCAPMQPHDSKRRRYQPDNGRTDAGGQAGIGTGRWQHTGFPYRRLSFTVTKANRHAFVTIT